MTVAMKQPTTRLETTFAGLKSQQKAHFLYDK